jgi:hypothetical protein
MKRKRWVFEAAIALSELKTGSHLLLAFCFVFSVALLVSCPYKTPIFDNPYDPHGICNQASGGVVAAPVISPSMGSYSGARTISLACATRGASIHYATMAAIPE